MAINITNLETVLNTKISNATTSTPGNDLLLISKSVEALDNAIGLKAADIGVNVQGYDVNTSKIDTSETRTANIDFLTYTEKNITIDSTGAINLSLGSVFTHTHTGAISSFTLSNVQGTGVSGFILILNNGGAYPFNWWNGIVWPAATPPTLTSAGTDIFTFTTPDSGTTWYAIPSGIGMA